MTSWMDKSVETDVNTAIQSQVIQTALEGNTTALTDAAFQSYLTNAPIPRCYYEMDPTWAANNGVNQFINWKQNANTFDPYTIMAGGGGVVNTIVCPIDGLYTMTVAWVLVGGGGPGYMNVYFYDPAVGLAPQHTSWLSPVQTGTAWQGQLTQMKFCRANQRWAVNVGNVTGAQLNTPVLTASYISVAWVAPYYNYKGGNT